MTYTLKKIDALAASLVLALLYFFIALITIPLNIFAALNSPETPGANPQNAVIVAFAMLVVMPVIGFIGGLIVSWLYNLVANITGGFKFVLTKE